MINRLLSMCLILGGLIAGPATAGPWLRAPGAGFLSFSTEFASEGDTDLFTGLYIEYGLNRRVTLGFDLGVSEDTLNKAIVFARLPLTRPDSTFKAAFELGLGEREDEAVFRSTLSLGQGFPLGEMSGWMAIDVFGFQPFDGDPIEITTDITFGANITRRSKLIFQLQSGDHLMDPDYLKFASSLVVEKNPGLHLEFGMLAGIDNAEDLAFKLGLWRAF